MATIKYYDPETQTWKYVNIPGGSSVVVQGSIPDYVKNEAKRVAKVVQSRQNANTITFLACSDPHLSTTHAYAARHLESMIHAGQGMKLVRDKVHVDFAAFFGDLFYDYGNETTDEYFEAARIVNANLAPAFSGIPNYRMQGNHDRKANSAEKITQGQAYAVLGAYNDHATVYYEGDRSLGVSYTDLPRYKVRIIVCNPNDGVSDGTFSIGAGQLAFITTALDISSLGDGWGTILLAHQPLDNGGKTSAIMNVIATATGVICQFHGHIHNYIVGTLGNTDIPRIGIPNICFYRNNESGENDGSETADGIEYGETTTYDKIAGTEEDTAFCVITIDREEGKVYADHYGAGYDREVDVPTWEALRYTNLVPSALAFDLSGAFNGVGYIDDHYLSTSAPYYSSDPGIVSTGLIPYKNLNADGAYFKPPTIYIKGMDLSTSDSHHRFGYAQSDGAIKSTKNASTWSSYFTVTELGDDYYSLEPLMTEAGANVLYATHGIAMDYIAFCGTGTGANLIITINEPIE